MNAARLNLVWILIVAGCAGARQPGKSIATNHRADVATWARRDIEMMHRATTRPADSPESEHLADLVNMIEGSVAYTETMSYEPYRHEVLAIAKQALKKTNSPEQRTALQDAIWFLELPDDERAIRRVLERTTPDRDEQGRRIKKPLFDPNFPYTNAIQLASASKLGTYDQYLADWIDQWDAAARKAGKWDGLALGYYTLAKDGRDDPKWVNRYLDRMLGALRDHPQFQDPNHGNSDGLAPLKAAKFLLKQNREKDLDRLIDTLKGDAKIDMLAAQIAVLAQEDRFDAAEKRTRDLSQIDPKIGQRLLDALQGIAPSDSRSEAASAFELRLRDAQEGIAIAHARRGEIDIAAAQLLADAAPSISVDPSLKVFEKRISSYNWAWLSKFAKEGGHPDAAREAIERGVKALTEPGASFEGPGERAGLVRDALAINDLDAAFLMLVGPPDKYDLSKAYRAHGDAARADEMLNASLDDARENRGASTMVQIALDLNASGQHERAAKLLLDAITHMAGEDFFLGDTSRIVFAAWYINRPDLLERLYRDSAADEQLIICLMAIHVREYWDILCAEHRRSGEL